MRCPIISICLAVFSCGCMNGVPHVAGGPDVVFIVPGVGGPTGYNALVDSLRRPNRSIQMITWGAPRPLFFLNYSDQKIHDDAERQFAQILAKWKNDHPAGEISIIGHSAGCGVALGAIAQLNPGSIDHLVLLAPSVSPIYDLWPALARVNGPVHVYTSEKDTLLEWRTGKFSTYDRVQTAAAGVRGFRGNYPSNRLVQHAFEDRWIEMGHEGGHWGPLAGDFSRSMIAPLLDSATAMAPPSLAARRTPATSPSAVARSSRRD